MDETKHSTRVRQPWVLLSLTQQLPQYIFHIGKHFAGWLMCSDRHETLLLRYPPPPLHTHIHICRLRLFVCKETKICDPVCTDTLACIKSHFLLVIRWWWWSDGYTYEMDPAVSVANGPEISEYRESLSLISLTEIKLSLIYDLRVCVINSNECRQNATVAFLDLQSDMTLLV